MDGAVPFPLGILFFRLSTIININYPRNENYLLSVVCDRCINPPEQCCAYVGDLLCFLS